MSLNVLVVEDDNLSRRNISFYLRQAGHKVVETNTGETAIDVMAGANFDAVISDYRLSGRINGMDVLRYHAQKLPGKRLILLTAFGSDDLRAETEASGAFYREKPIAMDDLLASVESDSVSRKSIEEVRTIDKLRESEELFRLLVEEVQDYAIYMLDPSGIVTTWNKGAERIKGYSAQEIIGKHFSCFYRLEDIRAGRPYRALNIAAREGKYEEEHLRVRKNGEEFWCSILITALRDKTGRLYGFTKVVRDITQRKENEEKMRQSERLTTLGTTAAVFAHEIGNPLNGLSTSLQLAESQLKRGDTPTSLILETLEAASKEVQRLNSLLKDYRSFARPMHLNLKPTNLRRAIQDVLAPNLALYKDLGIKLNLLFSNDLPLVQVDQERIKQVVLNLVKNAVEAMPDGGILTCKAYALDDQMVLEVSDTGTGITDGIDVFQLFKTTKTDGTGLGLPLAQQIISEHRGKIEYVSELQKGTTFRVLLPFRV